MHAVLAGVLPDDAVRWVRRSYHVGAVETAAQADWVRWFARRIHYGEAAAASWTASWLDGNISSGRLEAFAAEDKGALVGFAITMTVPASLRLGHFWQIRDLFVLPNHRRLGVGRTLLDFIRAAAISAGALRLVLQTEADNTPAPRLYSETG